MRTSNFILVKQFYTAMAILENLPLFQEQTTLIIGDEAIPSAPLVPLTSHTASLMIRQMTRWLTVAFSEMINPLTEIAPSAKIKPTSKCQNFKNYLTVNQEQILPLLLAYIQKNLPHLEKLIPFSTDGSIQGRCLGFAVTLAEAISEDQLDTIGNALGYLVMHETELKSGQTIARHKQLESIITSIVKKRPGRSAAGPIINLVNFDDSVFGESCQKMAVSGETLVFGSNYRDEKTAEHAIAVTLRIKPGNKRQYYLIDANGVSPQVVDYWPTSSFMVGVTANLADVQEFVKLALNLSKGMTVFIHALPLNPVVSQLIAEGSPDSRVTDALTCMLYPILSYFPQISSQRLDFLSPKTGAPTLKTYRRTPPMIEAKTMGALALRSLMLRVFSYCPEPYPSLSLGDESKFSSQAFDGPLAWAAIAGSVMVAAMQVSTLRSPALQQAALSRCCALLSVLGNGLGLSPASLISILIPVLTLNNSSTTTSLSLSDEPTLSSEPLPPALTLDNNPAQTTSPLSSSEDLSFSNFTSSFLHRSTQIAREFQGNPFSEQKVLTRSMGKRGSE